MALLYGSVDFRGVKGGDTICDSLLGKSLRLLNTVCLLGSLSNTHILIALEVRDFDSIFNSSDISEVFPEVKDSAEQALWYIQSLYFAQIKSPTRRVFAT